MKGHNQTERLEKLLLILQYDSFQKDNGKSGFFSSSERFTINQERSRILSGDDSFRQKNILETKIEFIDYQITKNKWKPI
jgi:hypothetical protein